MKKLLLICIIQFITYCSYCQSLHVDSTRFITGNKLSSTILNSAIPTTDGGILFVGWTGGNPGGIVPYFPDTTSANVLVGKMDNNKQISWIKLFGGTLGDNGMAACEVPDGGYAVLCIVQSLDMDVTDHKGANDLWLLRLDANGNVIWKKSYGSSYSDVALSVANTPDGGFVMLGNTNGSDGDVPFHYGGYFELDWLVVKTDGAGNVQWSRNLGSTADEYTRGAILAIDDSYYLIGASAGTDNDCTDTAWHSGVRTPYDCYILKMDAAGNVVWSRSYGGSGGEAAFHAIYDKRDSTIMITGLTTSSDYMVTENHGLEDVWVVKVNKEGNLIWQKSIGSSKSEGGVSICATHNGGYMILATVGGVVGRGDMWLIMTDEDGNKIADKVIGGTESEFPRVVHPFSGGYAIAGISSSISFTEGITYGRETPYQAGFISFIDFWKASVSDINGQINQLILVPNPATGSVKIIVPESRKSGVLSVMNSIGSSIYSLKFNGIGNIELNTDNWPAGAYLVQWQGDDRVRYNAQLLKK